MSSRFRDRSDFARDEARPNRIPWWIWLIMIIILVIAIIFLILWLTKSSPAPKDLTTSGIGEACSGNTDCATGLECHDDVCRCPPIQAPTDLTMIVSGIGQLSINFTQESNVGYSVLLTNSSDEPIEHVIINNIAMPIVIGSLSPDTYTVTVVPISQICGTLPNTSASANAIILPIII